MKFTIKEFDALESTNSYAIALAKQKHDNSGTVIHAFCQTNGRGQRDSAWKAEPYQNITLSVICKINLPLSQQFMLIQISALSVYKTIYEFISSEQLCIKWPNDILVGRKKIAGVLIENLSVANQINQSVIGVGVNVNQASFDADLLHKSTSIYIETGSSVDLLNFRDLLLENLRIYLEKLENESPTAITNEYNQVLFRGSYFESFEETASQNTFSAKILSVDNAGTLWLKMADSTVKAVKPGTIKYAY
ncbi:MAG: biotin--[acetyl-CoA-carboxylase] ligase [Luteibaculaceae bacterium]